MSSVLRSRIAAVAAGSAIIVGLGSIGAVADNLVGPADIRNGAVQKRHVAEDAVGASEIVNGSVHQNHLSEVVIEKLNRLAVPGPQGEQGAPGADGAVGPQGERGVAGADGAVGAVGAKGEPGVPGVDGTNGEDGTDGTNGLKGEPGTNGTNGAAGVSNYQIVRPPAPFISAGGIRAFFVPCPAGTRVLGGGYGGDTLTTMHASYPSTSATAGWWIEASASQNHNIGVYAICATVA